MFRKSNSIQYLVLVPLALTSCFNASSTRVGGGGAISNSTAVNVGLPDRNTLRQDVSNIDQLMNGYLLKITPAAQDCASPTQLNELGDYASSVSVNAKLMRGCDYDVSLSLGQKNSSLTSALGYIYLQNNQSVRITRAQLEGASVLSFRVNLQIQPEGQKIGLKYPNQSGSVIQPVVNPVVNPTVIPPVVNPTVNPTVAPPTTVTLPAGKDFAVNGPKGTKLSSYFSGQYLIIDISTSDCPYCLDRAHELDQDQGLQAAYSGAKCSRITVIDSLESWKSLGFTGNSFVGKNMAESNETMRTIAPKFGVSGSGTPLFFAIDRQGNVMPNTEDHGEPTQFVNQYCK